MRATERHKLVRRGRVINGRYRIEDVLGRGGMGVVMSARDLQRDAQVALKIPHRVRGRDAARLVAEARAVERLSSRHVARLYEAGTFDDGGVEVPFLALEYIDGVDLATWLRAHGRIAVADAAAIVVQACDAIGEAHALDIVHRDVKPANVMLAASPAGELVVKVLDFGIAREPGKRDRDRDEHGLTATGDLVGSPSYMAPEQLRPSDAVDARSDVWALGVVLFEAVAGRPPFEAASLPELCLHILLDEPPPLPDDCHVAIASIIRRCLDKSPGARFQSARELADALRPIATPAPTMRAEDLELATLEHVEDDGSVDGLGDRGAPVRPSQRRSSKIVIAIGAIAAALASGLAIRRHLEQQPATAASLPTALLIREPTRPRVEYVANDVRPDEQLANVMKPVLAAASVRRAPTDTHLPSTPLREQPPLERAPANPAEHAASATADPLASPF